MINFGYRIQKDRQIDFDSNSRRIIEYVRAGEPSVDWCMNCGTCASGCTAALTADYSLRRGTCQEMNDGESTDSQCADHRISET